MEGRSFCGGAAWQMVTMTSGVDDLTENHDWRSSPNLLFCCCLSHSYLKIRSPLIIVAAGGRLDCFCSVPSETNQHLLGASFTASVAVASL
jgi:hypothetical protein